MSSRVVDFERIGKPIHLFTSDELYHVLRNADDRVDNMLVINEDGNIKIIQEIQDGILYPVRNESWNAGNMYVGKYADLSDHFQLYIQLLNSWRNYLKYDKDHTIDYYHNVNETEAELIEEVKIFM